MSKQDINLLPPTIIAERVKRIYLQRAGKLYGVLMVGLLLVLLVYGGVGWILWNLHNELQDDTAELDSGTKDIQTQVRSLNMVLAGVRQYADANQPWLGHIQEALLAVPEGIVVQEIELKEATLPSGVKEQSVEVSGQSVSRSAVVEFEKALLELSWVGEVESPLKNLASGETVAYSFSLRRKQAASEEVRP